jgi:glycosyltransferase involved in cell wall biosynthesis
VTEGEVMAGDGVDVAVVVPTYRRADRVARLVAGLEAQSLGPDRFEVVVVDDCSDDGTADRLAALAGRSPLRLRVLRTPSNGGPAAARNLGWRSTGAPVVAFTDDDCVPRPGWLAAGLRLLAADPAIGIAQGRTELPPGEAPSTSWPVYREIYRPTPWFEGCNLFVRREALAAAGGFDETIAWFGEDTVLGWAVVDGGWSRGFADGAVVVHDVEERGLRWHVEQGRLEANLVAIARRFPAMRAELWRPWAVRPVTVAFLAAAGGAAAVVATRRRWPLVAALPYAGRRLRDLWGPGGARMMAERVVVDAAIADAMVRASIRHRMLLL